MTRKKCFPQIHFDSFKDVQNFDNFLQTLIKMLNFQLHHSQPQRGMRHSFDER
jgi:hypothetical protein